MAWMNRMIDPDRQALLAQMRTQPGIEAPAEPGRELERDPLRGTARVVPPATGGVVTPGVEPVKYEKTPDDSVSVEKSFDTSKWDTDGYAAPKINFQREGPALPGFDPNKWADPNKQSPKYVVGGVVAKFAPMVQNPETRQAGLDQTLQTLRQIYGEQVQFDGKDKYTGIPGLGPIDAWQGASSGTYNPQYFDVNASAAEDAAAGRMGSLSGGAGPSSMMKSLAPTDMGTYQALQARLMELLGGEKSFDRDALLAQMVR